MEQWRAAGPMLEQQRRRELQALTPERALAASNALLALATTARSSVARQTHSGLVEQQRLFHRSSR
jgi:hypothetical protein